MPLMGLGVFALSDESECIAAIHAAIDCGYRHIDTARIYGNEEAVGKAMQACGVDRGELFITTKLWTDDFGRETTRRAAEESLRKLELDYLDLYLIHWPMRERTEESWEVMQAMRDEGMIRSIGVSNFTCRRFEEQFFKQTDEIPAVNQIERHPFRTHPELVDYCREKGIQVEAYSPLDRGQRLQDPDLLQLAEKYEKSTAQIMLRYQLQQQIAVIPKSASADRIRENAKLFDFEISRQDMQTLDALDEGVASPNWSPEDDWF